MDFPYLLWRQKVGLPVAAVDTHHRAAWMREITDVVAVAKSPHPTTEIKRLLKAILGGRFTSATFNPLDPVPFFAEFALWISSGLTRQKNAKDFLQLHTENRMSKVIVPATSVTEEAAEEQPSVTYYVEITLGRELQGSRARARERGKLRGPHTVNQGPTLTRW